MTYRKMTGMSCWKRLSFALGVAVLGIGLLLGATTNPAMAQETKAAPAKAKKFKIYWNLSLTSGGWISAEIGRAHV